MKETAIPGGGGNFSSVGLTRTPKLKRRKYKGKITDDQLIRNPEFLEIPLNRTPAGSKIAALNERGMLVKEWTVPLTQRTLRLNFSQFASGIYRIVLPIKAGSSYQIRDIYYFKRNDPEFKFGFSGRALPGKYFFCPKVENLLPKRLSNYKSVEYDNLPRGESISAPPGNSSSVVVALGLFIARRMRTPVAWLALWFALFFTQTPVAFAEVRGGDKPEQRNIPSHHASPRLLTQPLTPTDSTGTDEYEWRWMAVFTDTCGVPASDEYLRWTYKVNDLPITNSTGGDTTYTITYGSEEYLCGAYSDTAYVEGGDSWIVNYRYIEGADMDSLEAKWEGVTPMGGIEFWAWDSTATRWFEIERIRGPPPMERHVNYFEVTDDSVYGNAPTHVQPRPPPDSYEKSYAVDHTPYLLSVPLSINESENTPIELDMTVYPNPANARFTVELPEEMTDGTVTLYAINGEVVDEEIINGKEVTFDVSDLPSGTYLIRAQDGFNQAKRKVSFLK